MKALSEKYADTYEDIENEIAKTQNELIKILDELTGSDTPIWPELWNLRSCWEVNKTWKNVKFRR